MRASVILAGILLCSYLQPACCVGRTGNQTILILGNSIVRHTPAHAIGWYGDWGMAATAADSDFVHRLVHNTLEAGKAYQLQYLNIAGFERDYQRYDLNQLAPLRGPDMLIVKLAENVDDYNALQQDFIRHYAALLDYLDTGKTATRIIVDGFWPAPHVRRLLINYARYHHYPYVEIGDLSADSTNMALGQYVDPDVARHPSDAGMRRIAARIWAAMQAFIKPDE